MRHDFRIEQRPHFVRFDPAHEKVGDPIRDVQVVRAAGFVAGVVAELEKIFDVGMPRFEIDAARTFSFAALVDGGDRRIEGFQPWHDAVRMSVRSADQRALRTNTVIRDADAAGEFRKHRDVGVFAIDAVEAVLRRIEQEAATKAVRASYPN